MKTVKQLLDTLQTTVMNADDVRVRADEIRQRIADGEATWHELGGEVAFNAIVEKAGRSLNELCNHMSATRFGL